MILDRIEISDINKYKRAMMRELNDFRIHRNQLKQFNHHYIMEQQNNVTIIKHEVYDLADRFDNMVQV